MITPLVQFTLIDEQETIIPEELIQYWSITSDVNAAYPTGKMVIYDLEGKFLSNLTIKCGNKVLISMKEGETIRQ